MTRSKVTSAALAAMAGQDAIGTEALPRHSNPNSTQVKETLMAHYVDGFVVPVPQQRLDAYRSLAARAGKIWMDHGALQYWECTGDDVKPGKITSFPQAVQAKDDEIVVLSWIVYKSREHRDDVNAKVMEDPRMKDMMDPKKMPFDGMRMFWGGFKSFLELSSETITA